MGITIAAVFITAFCMVTVAEDKYFAFQVICFVSAVSGLLLSLK